MPVAVVTGSAGLIGSESVRFLDEKGYETVGIDNDMRKYFFGNEASTRWNRDLLEKKVKSYTHFDVDIRDRESIDRIFRRYGSHVCLVIHAAGQPSHDWAASDPLTDFTVNANGTVNLLEAVRKHSPEATFIFTSTNKVYGDTPNRLPLRELETRWELKETHPYYRGIDESMSIDQSKHSLFGVSKVAADLMVQEYGRYFGMKTACFRGSCLTGPNHSGTQLHGFLAYLMKCAITGNRYTILGYSGKQVRDNIHSYDLVNMFWHFHQNPRQGEAYNAGGGRESNCSILEAVHLCEQITGKKMDLEYSSDNRIADHIWWISDLTKFRTHYPKWTLTYGIREILVEISEALRKRERMK